MSDSLMTEQELANKLSCSESTVRRLRQSGKIPFYRLGGHYRYNWPDVAVRLSNDDDDDSDDGRGKMRSI